MRILAYPVLALALGATQLALAAPSPDLPPATWPKLDLETQIQEPIASTRTGGAEEELANTIAQAMNADESLKHAKITVQPEEGSILLTGVAITNAQRDKAAQIATQNAGDRIVVNAIQSQELVISQPSTGATSAEPSTETVTTGSVR